MKPATWLGVALLALGLASMVFPLRADPQKDFRAGGVSFGVEARQQQMLSMIESLVMILGGAGITIVQRAGVPA